MNSKIAITFRATASFLLLLAFFGAFAAARERAADVPKVKANKVAEISHGVHKLPASGQIMVHAERGGSLRFADPPPVVRQLGDQAAAATPSALAHRDGRSCRMPLYLRVDVIETATGSLLSECEGVEPELFFRARHGSAARFAELVESRSFDEEPNAVG